MFDEAAPSDHALMQDPAFAQALRLCGQKPVTLPGGLTLLRRKFLGVPVAMLPRAAPPDDLQDQLRQMGLHRTPLILSPDRPCPLPRSLQIMQPRQIALLDLSGSSESRRAALHRKWRNQLRRAECAGLRINHGPLPPTPDAPLLRAEAQQSRTRGYANWPAPLTAAFAASAPHQTHLLQARSGGRTVASMLFLTHGRQATYHIGHITPAGKAVCAHNLLLWHATQILAQLGIRQLELGTLSPKTSDLNRFKLRMGAKARETGGTHFYWHPFARLDKNQISPSQSIPTPQD